MRLVMGCVTCAIVINRNPATIEHMSGFHWARLSERLKKYTIWVVSFFSKREGPSHRSSPKIDFGNNRVHHATQCVRVCGADGGQLICVFELLMSILGGPFFFGKKGSLF